jgi:hypothetical protein
MMVRSATAPTTMHAAQPSNIAMANAVRFLAADAV